MESPIRVECSREQEETLSVNYGKFVKYRTVWVRVSDFNSWTSNESGHCQVAFDVFDSIPDGSMVVDVSCATVVEVLLNKWCSQGNTQ